MKISRTSELFWYKNTESAIQRLEIKIKAYEELHPYYRTYLSMADHPSEPKLFYSNTGRQLCPPPPLWYPVDWPSFLL